MARMTPPACKALHILRGVTFAQAPTGRLVPRNPECSPDRDGRCRHCHSKPATAKASK